MRPINPVSPVADSDRLRRNNPPRGLRFSREVPETETLPLTPGARVFCMVLRCWVLKRPGTEYGPGPKPRPSARPNTSAPGTNFTVYDQVTGCALWHITARDHAHASQQAAALARGNGGEPADVYVSLNVRL